MRGTVPLESESACDCWSRATGTRCCLSPPLRPWTGWQKAASCTRSAAACQRASTTPRTSSNCCGTKPTRRRSTCASEPASTRCTRTALCLEALPLPTSRYKSVDSVALKRDTPRGGFTCALSAGGLLRIVTEQGAPEPPAVRSSRASKIHPTPQNPKPYSAHHAQQLCLRAGGDTSGCIHEAQIAALMEEHDWRRDLERELADAGESLRLKRTRVCDAPASCFRMRARTPAHPPTPTLPPTHPSTHTHTARGCR